MGPTKYLDTKSQIAFRNHRTEFLNGIRDRAETLWVDGYRVCPMEAEPSTFLVFRDGEESGYKLNPVARTCSCKFCTDQDQNPIDLKNPDFRIECKHLQGFDALIEEELSFWKMRYDISEEKRLQCPRGGCEERSAIYFARWDALSLAWARTQEEMHRTGVSLG